MAGSEAGSGASRSDSDPAAWQDALYATLKAGGIRQMSYVPDAGHARLIARLEADPEVACTLLTTEEEGVALAAGAWLGGQRSVLLMQSSGVGNCANLFSMLASCRFPFLTLVTMRGEWGEFNPWQNAMGQATPGLLQLMGLQVFRVERAEEAAETLEAAMTMAFDADRQVALLLSQRLIGAKRWIKE